MILKGLNLKTKRIDHHKQD